METWKESDLSQSLFIGPYFSSLHSLVLHLTDQSIPFSSLTYKTDVEWNGHGSSLCCILSKRCCIGLRSGQSCSSIANLLIHVCVTLAFITGEQPHSNRNDPSPKLFLQRWPLLIVPNDLLCWSSEVLSWEQRGRTESSSRQTAVASHQMFHLTRCSQAGAFLLARAKPRLIHWFARVAGVIHHFRELFYSLVMACFTPLHI